MWGGGDVARPQASCFLSISLKSSKTCPQQVIEGNTKLPLLLELALVGMMCEQLGKNRAEEVLAEGGKWGECLLGL